MWLKHIQSIAQPGWSLFANEIMKSTKKTHYCVKHYSLNVTVIGKKWLLSILTKCFQFRLSLVSLVEAHSGCRALSSPQGINSPLESSIPSNCCCILACRSCATSPRGRLIKFDKLTDDRAVFSFRLVDFSETFLIPQSGRHSWF